jgi:2-haloacid dehalogenase
LAADFDEGSTTRTNMMALQTETNRRQFLGTAAAIVASVALNSGALAAQTRSSRIKAVAFDAFAIFNSDSVVRLIEEMVPGRGAEFSNQWRVRQFEYTWLRNSMHRYSDFWHVTQDALNYMAEQNNVQFNSKQNMQVMSAYLQLKPWADVIGVLETLQKSGLRMALLANLTPEMLQSCVTYSRLESFFEFQLSTDRVKAFKPAPAAYDMGPKAFQLEKDEIAFVAFGGWDAAGAKAFGYPTYWVNRLSLPAEQLGESADATHSDLTFLPDFIGTLHGR